MIDLAKRLAMIFRGDIKQFCSCTSGREAEDRFGSMILLAAVSYPLRKRVLQK